MSLNHNRSDIYTETNQYGYQQTYQEDPSGAIPVCASCGCCVEVNRGQGTACTTCQREMLLECEHDYEEGRF